MNKRYLYIFCTVGFLLVALVAAMLIGNAGGWINTADKTLFVTDNTTEETKQNNAAQEPSVSGQTEQTVGTENDPDFEVEFGVGGRPAFGGETETAEQQKPSDTTAPVTTQPTQGQNKETTQPPVTGENGMPEKLLTYEEFLALSNEDQQAYFYLFADPVDYAQWLQQAQQEYEDRQISIIVTGPVDLETLP